MFRRRIILFLFLSTFLYFFIGGIISLELSHSLIFTHHDLNYNTDFGKSSLYTLVGLICLLAAYATFARVRFLTETKSQQQHDRFKSCTGVNLMALLTVFLIGCIGLALMIKQYGGQIPILSGGSDEFRTTALTSGLPQVLYFQLVAACLLAYSLLSLPAARSYRLVLYTVMLLSLVFILLGASRSMLFTPILVIILDLWRRKVVRTTLMALGIAVSGFAVFMIGLFRIGSQAEKNIYLLRLVTDFAPEFREFARLIEHIPEKIPYLNGQMFLNTLYILIPGKLLAVLGVDKSDVWIPFGQFLKDLFQLEFMGGGLRAGLIAEYYANFGIIGIIIGFYLMGIAVRYFEVKTSTAGNIARMFYLIAGVSVATSLLFTFDAVVYKIVSLALGWLVYSFCVWILNVRSVPADTC